MTARNQARLDGSVRRARLTRASFEVAAAAMRYEREPTPTHWSAFLVANSSLSILADGVRVDPDCDDGKGCTDEQLLGPPPERPCPICGAAFHWATRGRLEWKCGRVLAIHTPNGPFVVLQACNLKPTEE